MPARARNTRAVERRLALKDEIHTMRYPFFAHQVGDKAPLRFVREKMDLTIMPSCMGHATIHDNDIVIHVLSVLNQLRNDGGEATSTVTLRVVDLLKAIKRPTGGKTRADLLKALRRLGSTTIHAHFEIAHKRQRWENFVLLRYRYDEDRDETLAGAVVHLTIEPWVREQIFDGNVLVTLSDAYYDIRSPLEKAMYRLARVHTGDKDKFSPTIDYLREHSGSRATLRRCRQHVLEIVKRNAMPGFALSHNPRTDEVTFRKRGRVNARQATSATRVCDSGVSKSDIPETAILVEKRENRFSPAGVTAAAVLEKLEKRVIHKVSG